MEIIVCNEKAVRVDENYAVEQKMQRTPTIRIVRFSFHICICQSS